MSNYSKTVNFAIKDALSTGDPSKLVLGTEIDTEFNNIATAIGTKLDSSTANISSGTFTGTLTGMSGATTGTVSYTINGRRVTLYITANITGTSNATSMTMTGLPAAVRPTVARDALGSPIVDNSGTFMGIASVGTGGTITFGILQSPGAGNITANTGGFTGSGTKGLNASWSITYSLD